MLNLAGYQAANEGVAWCDRSDRVRLEVAGPDRSKFLHNLTTNDVKRLPVGRGCEAFVTSLQGKTSLFVLDTDMITLYQYGNPKVEQQVLAHPMAELAIAVISVEEELTGWYAKCGKFETRSTRTRLPATVASGPVFRNFKSCLSPSQLLSATRICVPLIAASAKTICVLQPSLWKIVPPW